MNKGEQELKEHFENLFRKKSFSIKDTGLTYRMINDWSKKGLINHLRKNQGDWHRLSLAELFEIALYRELRKIGFSLARLKKIKAAIYKKWSVKIRLENFTINLNPLERNILFTALGEDTFLATDMEAKEVLFLSDLFLAEKIFVKEQNSIFSYGKNNSIILINLKKILQSIGIVCRSEKSKFELLLREILKNDFADDAGLSQEIIDVIPEKNKELNIKLNLLDIERIRTKEYTKYDPLKSINKLIKNPNQKTTFHSGANGVRQVVIEKEIK